MILNSQIKNSWMAFIALSFGFFLIIMDTTVVSIAIPRIMIKLNAGLNEILWVLNAYILTYATLLIISGRLGDLTSKRRMYIAGLILFILSSTFCGIAQDAKQLIFARAIQGVGAAFASPQTLSILSTLFPEKRRGLVFGAWSAVAGVAATAGPMLGGLIITYTSWRWIFLINLPIGLISLLMTFYYVPDIYTKRHWRLDFLGAILGGGGIFAIVFGLINGQNYDWNVVWGEVTISRIIAFGIFTLFVFMLWEYTCREPLIPPSLFRGRNFTLMNGSVFAISFGILGLLLIMTIYLQSLLKMTALQTGLTIAPLSIVAMMIAPFSGSLTDRIGGKYLVLCGLLLFATCIALIMWLSNFQVTYNLLFLGPIILGGIGIGLTMAPTTTIAMRHINLQEIGAASGVYNTVRQLGSLFGSTVTGSILQTQFTFASNVQYKTYLNKIPVGFHIQFSQAFNELNSSALKTLGEKKIVHLYEHLPEQINLQFQSIFQQIYTSSFVTAMKPTLTIPIVMLLLSSASCLLVIEHSKPNADKL
jgi:EmrB/QacA subfamily drug resistance transporter